MDDNTLRNVARAAAPLADHAREQAEKRQEALKAKAEAAAKAK